MAGGSQNGNRRARDAGEAELHDRLDRLGERLDALAARRKPKAELDEAAGARPNAAGFARAMRLSGEFIGGVVAGALLGWGIDWLLGTTPWGLIVFLMLGFVAGILNVLRSAGLAAKPEP